MKTVSKILVLILATLWISFDSFAGGGFGKLFKKVDECVSAEVVDIETGRVLAAHREKEFRNPASTLKIITTSAALDWLGPDYRFYTDFYIDSAVEKGVLKGNLYVVGGGDPQLVIEKLWRLTKDLSLVSGIREIQGNVYIDQTLYDGLSQAYEDFEADSGRAFRAPLLPLSVNFNSFAVLVTPSEQTGGAARVTIDPPVGYARLVKASVKTRGGKSSRGDIEIDRLSVPSESSPEEKLSVSGRIGKETGPLFIYRSAADQKLYTERLLRWVFGQLGISVLGKVAEKKLPENNVTRIWREESRSLQSIVMDTNKFSLNLAAEHMFLALGRSHRIAGDSKNPAGRSVAAIREYLKQKGLWVDGTVIQNGSGLSRENKILVGQLTQVLRQAYLGKGFHWGPELIASLSILGVDGTMKTRFGEDFLKGEARLKTGLLLDVRGVAGFARTKTGRLVSVAMIMNSSAGSRLNHWQALERSLLERIHNEDFE